MSEQDLQYILVSRLQLRTPQFDLEQLPGGKFSGSVISDSFEGMTDSQRQKVIWDALDAALGAEVRQIGTLLAYTPAEWNVNLTGNP